MPRAALPTITSGSLASGDVANFSESYNTTNTGPGLTLTPAGAVSDGNGGNNYFVTFVTNTTGAITPVALTITLNNATMAARGGTACPHGQL